jgi:hypothetical protein
MNSYINKIEYYTNKCKYDNYDKYDKYKLKKYILKLGGGNFITHDCNKLIYNNKRTPSKCDRILYKSSNIKPTKYGVYYDNHLIRLSDHLLVYGEFTYNKKKGIIFTWNIAGIDSDSDIKSGIAKLLVDFGLLSKHYDMIIFCLQESSSDLFTKILVESLLPTEYKVSLDSCNSLLGNFDVRLIVFNKTIGMSLRQVSNYTTSLPLGLTSIKLNLEPNFFKSLLNNKTCVALTIDGLTIISCHFPLDTTKPDFGNDMRISAMRNIKEKFKDSKNILLAGDLNFRIVDNKDQLTEYLKNQKRTKFAEFTPPFNENTCKLETCK